ncbi:MAG TPA: tetratricopeptide repeat protein [Polyangiaceae bacterium]
MKRAPIVVPAALVACAAILAPCAARAQAAAGDAKAAAEALYEEGHTLDAQGRYAEACPKYAESLRLDPGIGVMLHLASCWEKAGKPASAWAEYREAEQVAARAGDNRSEVARTRAEALEARLHKLTIVVSPAAAVEGLAIVRDGETVGKAQWGAPVPVDPGSHTVVAIAPDKRRWQTTFVASDAPGDITVTIPALVDEARASSLPATPPAAAEPPTASPARRWGAQRIAAVATAAAGVVFVGVGTGFGIATKVKLDQSNTSGCQPNNHCTVAGAALRNDALDDGRIATIAFVAGLAAVAGGAVLWFTAPRHASTQVGVTVLPGGASIVGRW